MTIEILTQERLKSLLDYDPDTGVFTWLVNRGRTAKIGGKAGSLHIRSRKPYFRIKLCGKSYYNHRLAWFYVTGFFPNNDIDHINGNGCDNRFFNLRDVSCSDNGKNRRKHKNNTSGILGVSLKTSTNKWQSEITVNLKKFYLGCFDDFFEACCIRKSAENKHGFHANHGSIRDL